MVSGTLRRCQNTLASYHLGGSSGRSEIDYESILHPEPWHIPRLWSGFRLSIRPFSILKKSFQNGFFRNGFMFPDPVRPAMRDSVGQDVIERLGSGI